ncbi:protein translocase subunit SecD [Patescibacteria group bacterium]
MSNKKLYFTLIILFLLFLAAANLGYPNYFNKAADSINSQFNLQESRLKVPHFPEIPFLLGLDLQGGSHLLYEADLFQIESEGHDSAMQGLRDVIERRVNLFGVTEPVVQIQETATSFRLIVELAGIRDISQAIQMIGETPFLEFREERTEGETQKILDKQNEVEGKTREEIEQIENWQLAFEDPYFKSTQLTGKYLEKAELSFNQTTNEPLVLLSFDSEGAKIFEELTSRNIEKLLPVYIDQISVSMPVVQETISGGKAQISGDFTLQEAKELARNLNAGALPVPITLISQQTVGPILGQVSLERSLKAGVVGFLAVIIFMILFYRLPGILASMALLVYLVFILSILKLIPVTLTLAGIAGLILSIGMAVDANILIFSRMREELKEKKSFVISVEEGFRRAWSSIRDGNLTTLIVALILFGFGTSFVKGFALVLSLGVLVSMFCAIFITKNLLKLFIGTRFENITWLWK